MGAPNYRDSLECCICIHQAEHRSGCGCCAGENYCLLYGDKYGADSMICDSFEESLDDKIETEN